VKVWVDAQVAPAIAAWMRERLGVDAVAVRDLGLLLASDRNIFAAARLADAVVLTKDADFVELLEREGPPPRVVWLRCGNTSNARLRELLAKWWPTVKTHLDAGERLVEIADVAIGGSVT
jgi:predicted nuclease of predicted toxin-antitoxin system